MSKELARKPGENTAIEQAGPFDLTAMKMMADKIPALQEFMNKNLKQGVKADWENAHTVWKRPLKAGEEPKPMLLDPGVAKIMNFTQTRPRHRIIEKEIDTRTNNLRYVVAVELVPYIPVMYHNPVTNGMEPYYPVVAEGVGSSTTREKRYRVAFEYFKERDLKAQGWTEEELTKFTQDNPADFVKGEPPTRLFYLPTAESLGADNTLLKMAAKRANLDAVFQIPGVAGRFSQEADLLQEEKVEEKPPTPPPAATPPKEEKPSLKSVNLDDPVEQTIATIQATNRGMSRAQILAKIAEEKAKAAGLLTDEAAAYLVASELGTKQPEGFKSASTLPTMPEGFRLGEKAGYTADFIVENYSQNLDAVRGMIYAEMQRSGITDDVAADTVKKRFEERSKPEIGVEDVEKALDHLKLDSMRLTISADATKIQPKRFLGDDFTRFNDALRPLGYEWIRADKDSRWERKG